MTHFADLNLNASILKALSEQSYKTPTPIQQQAIPHVLAGSDFLGIAQTGTGKTAAFVLPLLHRLNEDHTSKNWHLPRSIILTPTRELAAQIHKKLKDYGKYLKLTYGVIFGGVNEKPQIHMLRNGVDVLVATPGRFLDLLQQNCFSLKYVQCCVLDEADRMLDMGFLPDIERIVKQLPKCRQTLLFSATLPQSIESLSDQFLNHPVRIDITPPATASKNVEQSLFFVQKSQKQELLRNILKHDACKRVLVFTRTKFAADRVCQGLKKGEVASSAIHGDKSQREREKALNKFKLGTIRVLVATDVASRGIDVADITHVINYDLPEEPHGYVHRIGRTGRAGNKGCAFSFCDSGEKALLRHIEKCIQKEIPVTSAKVFWPDFEPMKVSESEKSKKSKKTPKICFYNAKFARKKRRNVSKTTQCSP
ncbi:MAG: DEAD/DEAH box helicase [Puniceicoccales bacterium]|jgi:ATP-dependent RNA helicase RhlE|nr:DEAD/DEAH box helicase [Puniceicoccales bacterium]